MTLQACITATPLALEMEEYLKRTGISCEKAAQEMGYSRTALSLYLSGKRMTEGIEGAVEGYLESRRRGEQSQARELAQLLMTRDATHIMGVCQSAQEHQGLGVIVGQTGYGKTQTLKEVARADRVCYLECDDSFSPKDLVEAIEETLGLPRMAGTTWKRVSRIKEFFNYNPGYLLIIDEADKLITKYTQKKIEILRSIYDQSHMGMVIAGEPALEGLIKGHLPRFANRVDFFVALKGLNQAEVNDYLNPFEVEDDARAELIWLGTDPRDGCFRLLNRTMKNVLKLAVPGKPITLTLLREARKMTLM